MKRALRPMTSSRLKPNVASAPQSQVTIVPFKSVEKSAYPSALCTMWRYQASPTSAARDPEAVAPEEEWGNTGKVAVATGSPQFRAGEILPEDSLRKSRPWRLGDVPPGNVSAARFRRRGE